MKAEINKNPTPDIRAGLGHEGAGTKDAAIERSVWAIIIFLPVEVSRFE